MPNKEYMLRAIELAKKGAGFTNPNPLVGAVIVKGGRIIGEGYHEIYGSLHAERNALKNLTESAEGAEMYVTLEPCCHHGKQPPCTDAVIASGIKKIYVGSADPNPLVAGKGIEILRNAGIEVIDGFMREECDELNPVFFHFISKSEPYVVLKYAMTADGKIATKTGKSQWITGEEARLHVQELRALYPGILVGIGTVLADNPMLNCRLEGKRSPKRIVLDTKLRIPEDSKLVQTAKDYSLIVVCGPEISEEKKALLEDKGVEIVQVGLEDGHVIINEALVELGKRKIDAILVEGGSNINWSFVNSKKVNAIYTYVGAKVFGGAAKFSPVGGSGVEEVEDALILTNPKVTCFGNDVLIHYEAGFKE
ncbi:MAG: bifunctional diaminohydroxyphosphoribosylaminopyrimidine deaminase/5-amino-6-(5-phosphoribosylamino)uracil reductase RibD [Clostridia bacterium]|nr:bifunctional diaminohydroxyphosphoribosylaminopyrimidine deaminase/5-amino-6-(5-phosphoribosylamino)uracil reductase RibD [Clostridia bacterium]